jgi:hypothetical protein
MKCFIIPVLMLFFSLTNGQSIKVTEGEELKFYENGSFRKFIGDDGIHYFFLKDDYEKAYIARLDHALHQKSVSEIKLKVKSDKISIIDAYLLNNELVLFYQYPDGLKSILMKDHFDPTSLASLNKSGVVLEKLFPDKNAATIWARSHNFRIAPSPDSSKYLVYVLNFTKTDEQPNEFIYKTFDRSLTQLHSGNIPINLKRSMYNSRTPYSIDNEGNIHLLIKHFDEAEMIDKKLSVSNRQKPESNYKFQLLRINAGETSAKSLMLELPGSFITNVSMMSLPGGRIQFAGLYGDADTIFVKGVFSGVYDPAENKIMAINKMPLDESVLNQQFKPAEKQSRKSYSPALFNFKDLALYRYQDGSSVYVLEKRATQYINNGAWTYISPAGDISNRNVTGTTGVDRRTEDIISITIDPAQMPVGVKRFRKYQDDLDEGMEGAFTAFYNQNVYLFFIDHVDNIQASSDKDMLAGEFGKTAIVAAGILGKNGEIKRQIVFDNSENQNKYNIDFPNTVQISPNKVLVMRHKPNKADQFALVELQ